MPIGQFLNNRSDLMNPNAVLEAMGKDLLESVKKRRAKAGTEQDSFLDQYEDTPARISAEDLLDQARKPKRFSAYSGSSDRYGKP